MGLDMYLYKKHYIWHDQRGKLRITGANVDPDKVTEIKEEYGYWRKANAIHKWFVDNVQNGKDDCAEYYVSRQKLNELLDLVNQVLESSKLVEAVVTNGYEITENGKKPIYEKGKQIVNFETAHKLLPTSEGFFFGSTDYDQWYVEDLKETKRILESALESANEDVDFYYRSSW